MRVGFSAGIVAIIATAATGVLVGAPGRAAGNTVFGRLELPPAPERGPVIAKGFLDRVENPLAEIKKVNIAPYFLVALEGDAKTASGEVKWDLVGESFSRPVVGVPVGAELVIRNRTKLAWAIGAAEDAKLIVGPLNPDGSKSFRPSQPGTYTIGDKDALHLRGKVVVVATPYISGLDDSGRFEIANVPEGNYKLRVFYYDPASEARGGKSDWLLFSSDVTVASRGKQNRTEVNAKLPALAAAPGKK